MATFTAIRCKKQSVSSMRGVIDYVEQEKKTRWGNAWLVTGSNCVPQSAFIEMQMTKERFRKQEGRSSTTSSSPSLRRTMSRPRRSTPSVWSLHRNSSRISRCGRHPH